MALPPLVEDHLEPKNHKKRLQARGIQIILRLTLAFVLAFFINQLKLDFFESFLYDMRVRLRPAPETSGNVTLVIIDENTVQKLQSEPQAAHFQQLIQKLSATKPMALVFDLDLKELKGSFEDKQKMVRESLQNPEIYFMTEDLGVPGQAIKSSYPEPLDELPVFPGLKSADISNFAKDGVSRRMMIAYQGREMLHLHLAKGLRPDLAETHHIRGLFQFVESDQMYIDFRPEGTYPRIPFHQILAGDFNEELIRDHIIIVGQDLKTLDRDYARTPYSRDILAMTSAELHANMFDTLLTNRAPVRASPWVNFFFVALISLITVNVVFTMRPLLGLSILGGTLLGYGLIAFFCFWPFGIWISMVHPWLAIFLCYYFFIPYRLIIENRRSWEIYQKHNLLKQVEELKTNFISMMSHDLKTPIARIIGMTDVILRDSSPLSHQQREAVDTIKHSSDDLLKFINAILSYGRIESQSVQLNRSSRDLNQVLDEVIHKHEFLAKLKKIQVLKEYEPLFPISVDTDLMKQVFSNLIENAIKYSGEETKILVSTEEKNGFVIVQIADQGSGIQPEDLPHIFMKFYRSQKAKSSPIKGSGLGLYLAKYFVELHRGRIFVESTYGQGSTFTIELPVG